MRRRCAAELRFNCATTSSRIHQHPQAAQILHSVAMINLAPPRMPLLPSFPTIFISKVPQTTAPVAKRIAGRSAVDSHRHGEYIPTRESIYTQPPADASRLFWPAPCHRHWLSLVRFEPDRLPTKLDRVSSAGLVFNTTHRLPLREVFNSSFTNSMRLLPPLVVLSGASRPRTRALYSTSFSVSSPYFSISSGLRCLHCISILWSRHPSSWCT